MSAVYPSAYQAAVAPPVLAAYVTLSKESLKATHVPADRLAELAW
jgi:hypothetical protein